MSRVKVTLTAGLAALALGGGMMMASAPAEAQEYGWRNRGGAGYYGRPAYRSGNYSYRTTYYRGRRSNVGGAVAAGVIGGLALGAIAAGAARPAYAAPVAPGYAYPAYGRPAYYGGDCYEVRRRYVDDWGRRFYRHETVCH